MFTTAATTISIIATTGYCAHSQISPNHKIHQQSTGYCAHRSQLNPSQPVLDQFITVLAGGLKQKSKSPWLIDIDKCSLFASAFNHKYLQPNKSSIILFQQFDMGKGLLAFFSCKAATEFHSTNSCNCNLSCCQGLHLANLMTILHVELTLPNFTRASSFTLRHHS